MLGLCFLLFDFNVSLSHLLICKHLKGPLLLLRLALLEFFEHPLLLSLPLLFDLFLKVALELVYAHLFKVFASLALLLDLLVGISDLLLLVAPVDHLE